MLFHMYLFLPAICITCIHVIFMSTIRICMMLNTHLRITYIHTTFIPIIMKMYKCHTIRICIHAICMHAICMRIPEYIINISILFLNLVLLSTFKLLLFHTFMSIINISMYSQLYEAAQ